MVVILSLFTFCPWFVDIDPVTNWYNDPYIISEFYRNWCIFCVFDNSIIDSNMDQDEDYRPRHLDYILNVLIETEILYHFI